MTGFIKDVLSFENFNLKNMWGKIKDNPARMLYGGHDPASTKAWNKVLGRNDEPLVNQLGGASKDTYGKASDAGINTKPGKTMHNIASAIVAAYAGGYGASQMGATTGGAVAGGGEVAGGGAIAGAEGAGAAAGAGTGAGAVAGAGGNVLPTVVVTGTSTGGGLGGGAAIAGGSVAGGAAVSEAGDSGDGKKGWDWKDMLDESPPQGEEEKEEEKLKQDKVEIDNSWLVSQGAARDPRMSVSSRRAKVPANRGVGAALQRGIAGQDVIDQNGVEMLAIQALNKQLDAGMKRLAELKRRKGAKKGK